MFTTASHQPKKQNIKGQLKINLGQIKDALKNIDELKSFSYLISSYFSATALDKQIDILRNFCDNLIKKNKSDNYLLTTDEMVDLITILIELKKCAQNSELKKPIDGIIDNLNILSVKYKSREYNTSECDYNVMHHYNFVKTDKNKRKFLHFYCLYPLDLPTVSDPAQHLLNEWDEFNLRELCSLIIARNNCQERNEGSFLGYYDRYLSEMKRQHILESDVFISIFTKHTNSKDTLERIDAIGCISTTPPRDQRDEILAKICEKNERFLSPMSRLFRNRNITDDTIVYLLNEPDVTAHDVSFLSNIDPDCEHGNLYQGIISFRQRFGEIIDRIPFYQWNNHRRYRQQFIELMNRFQQDPNAVTREQIEAFVDGLLNPPQPVIQPFVIQPVGMQPGNARPNINFAQSTHAAGVHKSVSESAIRLSKIYRDKLHIKTMDVILNEIKAHILGLSKNDVNEAAKRAVLSFENHRLYWTYQDKTSGITTCELLALAWLAIHDDTRRNPATSLEEAKELIVVSLYEIQRAYNLDDKGIDISDGNKDVMTCAPGGFNKFIEKLVGVHPDVELIFMTKESATIKLKALANEKIVEFFKNQEFDTQELQRILSDLEENGCGSSIVKKAYAVVKIEIEKIIAEEFNELFVNTASKGFQDFLDAGVDLIDEEKIISLLKSKQKELVDTTTSEKKPMLEENKPEDPVNLESQVDLENKAKLNELLVKAEQNDARACLSLGNVYKTGILGQMKDIEKAKFYYERAAVSGNAIAKIELKKLNEGMNNDVLNQSRVETKVEMKEPHLSQADKIEKIPVQQFSPEFCFFPNATVDIKIPSKDDEVKKLIETKILHVKRSIENKADFVAVAPPSGTEVVICDQIKRVPTPMAELLQIINYAQNTDKYDAVFQQLKMVLKNAIDSNKDSDSAQHTYMGVLALIGYMEEDIMRFKAASAPSQSYQSNGR